MIFDKKALYKVIELNWFERCYANRSLGMKAVTIYMANRFMSGSALTRLAKAFIIFIATFSRR
jgi:hypothetical protein